MLDNVLNKINKQKAEAEERHALYESERSKSPINELKKIHPNSIEFDPNNPRKTINNTAFFELKESIHTIGLQTMFEVLETEANQYMVINGHRRLKAIKEIIKEDAGHIYNKKGIDCIVIHKVMNRAEKTMNQLLSNFLRDDISALEQAEIIKSYKEETKKSQDEIAKEIGKSKSTISKYLKIAEMPTDAKKKVFELSTKDKKKWNLETLSLIVRKNNYSKIGLTDLEKSFQKEISFTKKENNSLITKNRKQLPRITPNITGKSKILDFWIDEKTVIKIQQPDILMSREDIFKALKEAQKLLKKEWENIGRIE